MIGCDVLVVIPGGPAVDRAHSFERTFAARIDHLKAIAGR